MSEWSDPRVQQVYEILCSEEVPPDGEHWEGFVARKIVDAADCWAKELTAERDAAIKDAERYRFIRNACELRFGEMEIGSDEELDEVMQENRDE